MESYTTGHFQACTVCRGSVQEGQKCGLKGARLIFERVCALLNSYDIAVRTRCIGAYHGRNIFGYSMAEFEKQSFEIPLPVSSVPDALLEVRSTFAF